MTSAPAKAEAPARRPVAADSLRSAWHWWLPPALVALLLALLCRDPFAGDWDALDYTVLALRGVPSSMLFGRTLFIYTNHLAYTVAHAVFGLPPEDAYLLFKYMVVAESPAAVVGMWAFARRLTQDRGAATVAALLLALSPFYVIYSGQAMTEIPSLLLLTAGLALHLRGMEERRAVLVLVSAALLGLNVNVRESVGLYGIWLVLAPLVYRWRLDRRTILLTAAACGLFFVCALGPFAVLYVFDLGGYRGAWHGWVASMRAEEGVHPVTAFNLVPLAFFFFVAAPVAFVLLPVAAWREWRARGFTPLLVLALVGLCANLSLITHYSAIINGRYQLTGLPGLLPLVACHLVARRRHGDERRALRRALLTAAVPTLLVGGIILPFTWPTLRGHGLTKEYRARLAQLPPDAVVMAGGQTVAVTYYRGLGLGAWDVIGTGGGWPGARLPDVINEHLRAGRRVFVDTDPRLWFTDSWRGEETRQLVALEDRYRFRRVTDTIYELRPRADETARDEPQLARLLAKPPSRLPRRFRLF